MIGKLRVAHKLLLIYLLSLISVLFLAYSLVSEKEKAINFAAKKMRGNAYAAVVRQAMVAVTLDLQDRRRTRAEPDGPPDPSAASLKAAASAVVEAELQHGHGMKSAALSDQFDAAADELADHPPLSPLLHHRDGIFRCTMRPML